MKIVKESGKNTWSQRRLTMHGSTAEHRLQVLNGKAIRAAEKPGNTYTMGNHNVRTRGSKAPRGQKP